MAMRRRDLSRKDDLQSRKEAASDARFALHARILKDEDAAFRLLGRDDLAGLHQIRPHLAPFPDRRNAGALWRIEHEVAEYAPERRQIPPARPAVEFHAAFLGFTVYRVGEPIVCHGSLLARER